MTALLKQELHRSQQNKRKCLAFFRQAPSSVTRVSRSTSEYCAFSADLERHGTTAANVEVRRLPKTREKKPCTLREMIN